MLNVSYRDLVSIYFNTVVSDDGCISFVKEIKEDLTFIMESDKGEYTKVFKNFEDLPKAPRLPCYLNDEGKYCVFLIRRQYRRYKQGVCDDNTKMCYVGENGVLKLTNVDNKIPLLLASKTYPTKKQALELLSSGKKVSVAIDSQICLTRDLLILFNNKVVGKLSPTGEAILEPNYQDIKRYNTCLN